MVHRTGFVIIILVQIHSMQNKQFNKCNLSHFSTSFLNLGMKLLLRSSPIPWRVYVRFEEFCWMLLWATENVVTGNIWPTDD